MYNRMWLWLIGCVCLVLLMAAVPAAAATLSSTGVAPVQSASAKVPSALPVLVGHVTWQGRPAQPNAANQLPITLTLQSSTNLVTYANQPTSASGTFTVSVTTLPHGVYTWWAKGQMFLATTGTVTLTSAPSTSVELGTQRAGDINNDNLVDIIDASYLRAAFGTVCWDGAYNPNAEFTGDCLIDSLDFTLLRGNFGLAGAPVITPTPTRTSTPLPTATPTATRTPASVCAVFPADNIWNRLIADLPPHAKSDNYIASIGLTQTLHPDFGSGTWQGQPIGIPYLPVANQPFVPIQFTQWGSQSDPGPYPIPTDVPIEGGSASMGDRHVLVVDTGSCILYEMYHAYPQANGSWNAGAGAVFNLNSNALRPNGWTSADAAGLPIYAGLVRYDEVVSGVIRHAIRFTTENMQEAYVWPARHSDGNTTDPSVPPMGTRLRLKASVDISGFSASNRVILQALKDYGMILADTGSGLDITGAPDEHWNNTDLHNLLDLHASDFEAVDVSSLMIDPNSGQSR